MGSHKNLILDATLGWRDEEQRASGYVDCKTEEEYGNAEDEISDLISNLHPNGHLVASFFRNHKAPQLREHYSVRVQHL